MENGHLMNQSVTKVIVEQTRIHLEDDLGKKLIMCQMCNLTRVTCHLSLTPTATATDPPTANSPTMQSKLVRQEKLFFCLWKPFTQKTQTCQSLEKSKTKL